MKYIYCSHNKTGVTNSREIKKGILTWRRRHCQNCKETFTTKETPLADNLFVIKRNGTRQRFSYEKLFVSVFTVLNNKKGSDNGDDAKTSKDISENIINDIISRPKKGKNIFISELIATTYTRLKEISTAYADHYIYYSSHRREAGIKAGLITL
jgi:transcriptional regulator NrdR family protein